MKVLVTGATGFVGQVVSQHLLNSGFFVQKVLRKKNIEAQEDSHIVGEINASTDWSQALIGIDSIVHFNVMIYAYYFIVIIKKRYRIKFGSVSHDLKDTILLTRTIQ